MHLKQFVEGHVGCVVKRPSIFGPLAAALSLGFALIMLGLWWQAGADWVQTLALVSVAGLLLVPLRSSLRRLLLAARLARLGRASLP